MNKVSLPFIAKGFKMYKKLALLGNMILMFWFFFDMIGLKIGNIGDFFKVCVNCNN